MGATRWRNYSARCGLMVDFLLNLWRLLLFIPADTLYKIFYRARRIGYENIPKSGGVLIASNHVSNMETVLIPYMSIDRFSMRRFWHPGKEELFRFAPIKAFLWSCRAFPVKRGKHDYSAMKKIARLAENDMVMLFPEGTRSRNGKLGQGKPGVGKIIHDSKTTVIPTAVFNTQYCMPRNARSPNLFLPLTVVFGKPLNLQRYFDMPSGRETSKAIVDEVMRAIANLQKEYAYLNAPPANLLKKGHGNSHSGG